MTELQFKLANTDNVIHLSTPSTQLVVKKGYSPYLNRETNTWWEYNDINHQFQDTKVIADYKVNAEVNEDGVLTLNFYQPTEENLKEGV